MEKPTPENISAYGLTIGFKVDGELFWNYYESKGWRVGTHEMRCWKAAVRTWKINSKNKGGSYANNFNTNTKRVGEAKVNVKAYEQFSN